MTWPLLQLCVIVYVAGLWWLRRQNMGLLLYVWGALGLAFLVIHLALLQGWNTTLAAIEIQNLQTIMGFVGVHLQTLDPTTVLIPDNSGLTELFVGIECTTLIELAVFAGLLLYYPRYTARRRWLYLAIGAAGTYLLNILRMMIILGMIMIWGKSVVFVAHAVVARLFYFAGVMALYWFLLTTPTLALVRRSIEVSGRGVR